MPFRKEFSASFAQHQCTHYYVFFKVFVVATEAYLRKLSQEMCSFSTQTDLMQELYAEKSVVVFPAILTDLIDRIISPYHTPLQK